MTTGIDREPLQPGNYGASDLDVNDWYCAGALTVSTDMIDKFANLTGDFFEIHMTQEGATRHGFRDRVAHGLLVLSLLDGLKNQAPVQFKAIASLNWNWSFHHAVYAGDTLTINVGIDAIRPTKKQGRSVITMIFNVTNQEGDTVQLGTNQVLAYN